MKKNIHHGEERRQAQITANPTKWRRSRSTYLKILTDMALAEVKSGPVMVLTLQLKAMTWSRLLMIIWLYSTTTFCT